MLRQRQGTHTFNRLRLGEFYVKAKTRCLVCTAAAKEEGQVPGDRETKGLVRGLAFSNWRLGFEVF